MEASLRLFSLFFERRICINFKQLDLVIDIVHSLLEIALLAVSWKVQRLKRRESSHKFFIGEQLLAFASDLSANSFKLFTRELHSIKLSKVNHSQNIYISHMSLIDLVDHLIELKAIFLNEFFSEMLDSSVVLYLFFKELGYLALTIVFEQLVRR